MKRQWAKDAAKRAACVSGDGGIEMMPGSGMVIREVQINVEHYAVYSVNYTLLVYLDQGDDILLKLDLPWQRHNNDRAILHD